MQFWSEFSIVTRLPGPCVVSPCASRRTLSPALLSSQPAPQSRETHCTREQNLPAQACELKLLYWGCSCNVNGARTVSLGVSSALFLAGWARRGSVAAFVPWQTTHRLAMWGRRSETPTSKGQKRCRALLNTRPFPLPRPNRIFGKLVPCTCPWRYLPKLAIVW